MAQSHNVMSDAGLGLFIDFTEGLNAKAQSRRILLFQHNF